VFWQLCGGKKEEVYKITNYNVTFVALKNNKLIIPATLQKNRLSLRKLIFVIMKKYLSLVLMVLFGLHSFAAGQWVKVTSSTPSKPVTALVSSDNSQTVIHLSVDGFWKSEVQTPQGSAWLIDLGNSVRNLEQGAPDLPYVSTSLIIPDLSKMKVEIVSASYQDFENVLIVDFRLLSSLDIFSNKIFLI